MACDLVVQARAQHARVPQAGERVDVGEVHEAAVARLDPPAGGGGGERGGGGEPRGGRPETGAGAAGTASSSAADPRRAPARAAAATKAPAASAASRTAVGTPRAWREREAATGDITLPPFYSARRTPLCIDPRWSALNVAAIRPI